MKKVFVFGAISLILLIVVLSGCQKNVAGEATAIAKGIRANSCDADNMCETNNLNTNRIIAGKVVIADSSVAGSSETNVITTTPDLTNLVLTSGTNFAPSRKDRKSTRLNSSHNVPSRMPSSA